MITKVEFFDTALNPAYDKECIAVSSFRFTVDQTTGKPIQLVLNIAIDSYAGQTTDKDFPVYIPARTVFHTEQHMELLNKFKNGEPFVFIVPLGLEVFSNFYNNCNHYFGYANNFSIWEDWNYEGKNSKHIKECVWRS